MTKRLVVTFVLGLVLVAGCSGGGDEEPAPSEAATTSAAPAVDWSVVCPGFQDALDEHYAELLPDNSARTAFADDIEALVEGVEGEGKASVLAAADASRRSVGAEPGNDALEAQDELVSSIDNVARVCEDEGSPLD